MFQRTLPSAANVVCVADEDASALKTATEVLSSTGYEIRPFRDGDTFFECGRIQSPDFAIVDFGGTNATGLAVAACLLVNLGYRKCTGRTLRPPINGRLRPQTKGTEHDRT